ncbi:trafficking protein particle complex subunit 6A [Plasmodium yoelii yoelii]|uniref:Trafficking protein particle complex subunit 6A n=1 Tax=Plasmodium yoelii yoelii TaxID=73239 RepID=A0AAE9WY35_PLAYO|nr:trafficking protein particle complex subunit 6A [Plasmodium yoelii yoelii]
MYIYYIYLYILNFFCIFLKYSLDNQTQEKNNYTHGIILRCAFLNTCDCSREKKILNNSKIKNKNNRIKSNKN